jgi:hypothetical protein
MSFSTLKVSANISFDEVYEFFSIEITAELFGIELFNFSPENQGSVEDWNGLIEACENGSSYGMYWQTSNGDVYIDVINGVAEFCVSKRGDGNGGNLTIKIPSEFCLDAFKLISKTMS